MSEIKGLPGQVATLRELEAFTSVYECRSFAAAAHRTGTPVGHLRSRIQRLSEKLGARLFAVDQGAVRRSEFGDEYYRLAKSIVQGAVELHTL